MVSFPKSDRNPQDKDAKYYSDMCQSIWREWSSVGTFSFYNGAGKYNRIESYALGKQSVDPYKPRLNVDDKGTQWMAIDWTPLPVLPKIIRIINSLFRKVNMTPELRMIDPYSAYDKKDWYDEEMANINMRDVLGQAGIDPSLMDDGTFDQPKTREELEIKKQFGWKHNIVIAVENGLEKFKIDIDWDEERERVRESLIKRGAGGYKIYTDADTGQVCARAVDISTFFCSPTKDPYLRDIWYAGEVIYVLASDIRKKLGDKCPEHEIERLAYSVRGKYGNPHRYENNNYDSAKIPVVDMSFKDENTFLYEKRYLKTGNPVIGKAPAQKNKPDREYYKDNRNDILKCKWIMDSSFVYDYGLENDMVKKASRYWDAQMPFIMIAPGLHNMETTSITEEQIPFVDAIHLAWYKLQNVISQARPKGIIIDIAALSDVSLTNNGDTLQPIELLDLFNKKGIIVTSYVDQSGARVPNPPISEINNGLGAEAQEYFAIIEKNIALIKSSVGLNDVTDGSTPDERMLNGVASLAQESTNNALHHIFNAEKSLFERLFDNAAQRIYDSIVLKKSDYYSDAVGEVVYEHLKKTEHKGLRELGISAGFMPSQNEKAKLEQDANIAQQSGQITIADKYEVMGINNIKQAQQILAYRIKKNLEEAHKREMEKLQTINQQNQTLAQATEEERRKTLEMEMAAKERLIMVEYDRKMELKRLELEGMGYNKQGEMDKKKEIQEKANEGLVNVAKEKKTTPAF